MVVGHRNAPSEAWREDLVVDRVLPKRGERYFLAHLRSCCCALSKLPPKRGEGEGPWRIGRNCCCALSMLPPKCGERDRSWRIGASLKISLQSVEREKGRGVVAQLLLCRPESRLLRASAQMSEALRAVALVIAEKEKVHCVH